MFLASKHWDKVGRDSCCIFTGDGPPKLLLQEDTHISWLTLFSLLYLHRESLPSPPQWGISREWDRWLLW